MAEANPNQGFPPKDIQLALSRKAIQSPHLVWVKLNNRSTILPIKRPFLPLVYYLNPMTFIKLIVFWYLLAALCPTSFSFQKDIWSPATSQRVQYIRVDQAPLFFKHLETHHTDRKFPMLWCTFLGLSCPPTHNRLMNFANILYTLR